MILCEYVMPLLFDEERVTLSSASAGAFSKDSAAHLGHVLQTLLDFVIYILTTILSTCQLSLTVHFFGSETSDQRPEVDETHRFTIINTYTSQFRL